MADSFGRQFSSLAGKLKIDPKKDGELKKSLDGLIKALEKESDDVHDALKKALDSLGKKKKDAKDDEKKTVVALEAMVKTDIDKRFSFKDTSSSPS
jgi:hypothetical protein